MFSVIWVGLVGAVGYFHTDVFLAGRITPAQDHAISQKYRDLAGPFRILCGSCAGEHQGDHEPYTKRTLLDIAGQYDHLAEKAEERNCAPEKAQECMNLAEADGVVPLHCGRRI